MRLPNGLPAGQGVPQIRSQVNISGQQPRVALNALQLTSTRIANSSVMQARALQAAQAQQQGHPGVSQSLAAGAAPALNAHLSPPFNGQRTASTSPGAGQQSPPPVAAQSTATSPRPPSAQTQVQAQAQAQQAQAHLSMPQVQSPMQRAALANYYASLQHTGHLTPEQMAQAAHMRNIILQQVRYQLRSAWFILVDECSSRRCNSSSSSSSKHKHRRHKLNNKLNSNSRMDSRVLSVISIVYRQMYDLCRLECTGV